MITISHFIITRFNLRLTDSLEGGQLDDEWLRNRLDLFDKFCFPSVRSQSEQDFKWLVLFDIETPEKIKECVKKYQEWNNFIPIFVQPGQKQVACRVVLKQLKFMPDILITTRLDNDDGLCRTFVEEIRHHAKVTEPTVLEFPVGYVWHRKRIYLDRQNHNPFTTLVEPLYNTNDNKFNTIYSGSHLDVEKLGCVKIVTEEPSWIQVIHGGNIANKPRGIRHSSKNIRKLFDIESSQINTNENPYEYFFDKAKSIVRKKIYTTFEICKGGMELIRTK